MLTDKKRTEKNLPVITDLRGLSYVQYGSNRYWKVIKDGETTWHQFTDGLVRLGSNDYYEEDKNDSD